ncbi:hypothetical protein [Aquimarina sediminis]|uniref:hypothetical protein n=1 Tax=Aquimarina sediminis TaxID=2070536 RepID=UPI000FFE4D8E|nr:hypothetical protein [Aquimarina sediminis]
MKLYNSIFFLLFLTFTYGQELSQNEVNTSYEVFLEAVAKKDTLIKQVFKRYKCSEYFSGSVNFYYKDEKLKLIKHLYKQHSDVSLEYYFIENDTLRLQTVVSEITRFNTFSFKSAHENSSSIEKVLEVTEFRTFFDNYLTAGCYEKKHMEKLSEWDNDLFKSLDFNKSSCLKDNVDDVHYKYRLLRKAETKLISYRNKPSCIFYMW